MKMYIHAHDEYSYNDVMIERRHLRLWKSRTSGGSRSLAAVLLELPLSVIQRAHISSFEPSRDTVEVEGMIADPPGHSAFSVLRSLVGLAFDAKIHDVVSANSAVVHDHIPRPQSHSIPFLHFEPRLPLASGGDLLLGRCGCGRVYFHLGCHFEYV